MKKVIRTILGLLIILFSYGEVSAFIVDHKCTDISNIPTSWLQAVRDNLRIGYSHTSHGSQLISGITAFRGSIDTRYFFTSSGWGAELNVFINDYWANDGVGDLGHNGDLSWVTATEAMLDDPDNDRNVVIWSWCGGVSDNTADGIDTYLNAMHQLEQHYPGITFVYMTGHLDGGGVSGTLHQMNERIRKYCRNRNKILFDFADIESYDPDGVVNFMQLFANDNCDYRNNGSDQNWACDWMDANPATELAVTVDNCDDCAHSQCLNCVLKGRGFWWMMAQIAGWKPGIPTPPAPVTELYYPHVASGSGGWQTEICALNPDSRQVVSGVFKAYNNDGQPTSDNLALSLTPHARQVINIAKQFKNPESIGYIVLECDSENITGFIKFFIDGACRVAIPAVSQLNAGTVPISHIASDQRWWTGLSLVNTALVQKSLKLHFNNGVVKNVTLDPGEHRAFSIKSLFNDTPQPGINSANIEGMDGVIGLELFGNGKQLSGILLSDKSAKKFYFPHIVDDQQWWTGIVVYNPLDTESVLTISPYTVNGSPLPVKRTTLLPFARYWGTMSMLDLTPETAWLKLESASGVSGFELFGTSDNLRLAGYSGVGISGSDGILANLEKDGWTGVALVNLEATRSTVQLKAYNDSGKLIAASETIVLQAHEKKVQTAARFFTTSLDGATYITYATDGNELVAFQLNNSADNSMLDALPALR